MGLTITPDYTEAQEAQPVPAGVYNVRVDSWEEKASGPESKNPGTKYLNWTLVIFGADGDYAKQNNRKIWLTTMLKGPGAGILRDFSKACFGTAPATFDTDDFIGKELQVTLVDRIKPDGERGNPNIKTMKAITH